MNLYSKGIHVAETGAVFRQGNLVVFPTIDTTMRVMSEMIRSGEADAIMHTMTGSDKVTVLALEQSSGVGSADPKTGAQRQWWSGKGNLLFSRAVPRRQNEFANEIEFLAAVAVAEIIAELLPHACIALKFPNDVLVDGAKICGVLVRPSEYDFAAANLGVGVNIGQTPPSPFIREGAEISDVTSLKEHGVAITLDAFLEKFDARFDAIRQACPNFTSVMQRIGFADAESGEITLWSRDGGPTVRGMYSGFSARETAPGVWAACLHLKSGMREDMILLMQNYAARSSIRPASAAGTAG